MSSTVTTKDAKVTCVLETNKKTAVATYGISEAFSQINMGKMVHVVFEGGMVYIILSFKETQHGYVHVTKKGETIIISICQTERCSTIRI